MSLGVSYMGTKRHLVPSLCDVISSCRDGVFLDVFSGMCSVGRAMARDRQVWSNDLQYFAQAVAATHFCAEDEPVSRLEALGIAAALKRAKVDELSARFSTIVDEERRAVQNSDTHALAILFDKSVAFAQSLSSASAPTSYDLFCNRYAGTYFGYQQAIEIDATRYALDSLKRDGRITPDQWRTMLVALCTAMARCSNSTGHFAQSLRPKTNNIKKVVSKRLRSVSAEWLNALDDIIPLRSKEWRGKNHAFRKDATDLLVSLNEFSEKPSVVYADPPYTKDQYSRYYHIFETAILYDHPTCVGTGLYRPDRASSPFSLASKVGSAMDDLIAAAARIGSCLVLSYPENGLLENSTEAIPELIRKHFGIDAHRTLMSHQHSTMGASKGASSQAVTEVIYRVMI